MAEDELIENMREKFRVYYEYQLVPVLERLEELRKKYKLVQGLVFIPLVALLGIALFFCYDKIVAHYEEGRDLLLYVGLGFAAIGGFLLTSSLRPLSGTVTETSPRTCRGGDSPSVEWRA